MNDWYSSCEPLQATPTNSACPAHRCAAASTEEASRLQLLHHGAQNHSNTGRPASVVSSMSPPPISGAANWSASGTLMGSPESDGAGAADGADVAADEATGATLSLADDPQAASRPTAIRGSTTRFTARTVPRGARSTTSPRSRFGIVQILPGGGPLIARR